MQPNDLCKHLILFIYLNSSNLEIEVMNILALTTLTHPLKIDTLKFEHIYELETLLLPVFIKVLLQKTRKPL